MPAKKSKPKSKPSTPFLSESSEECFKHFAKLVAGTPADELEVYNADPEIVRVNLGRGVEAIRPHVEHITKALPLLDVNELLELPALALALGFAAERVFVPASLQEIKARQQQLRPVRSQALRYLEIVAEMGLLPRDRVAAIRANTGPIDEARDGVAIAALFNEHAAALEDKHPFSTAALKQLGEDGNWLLSQLLPKGANPEKAERSADALLRDQLWTELVSRYDDLYQAGVAVWGRRKVNDYIPSLLSRAAAPAKPREPAAPDTASGNTATPA